MAYQVIQQAVGKDGALTTTSWNFDLRKHADNRHHTILANGAVADGYSSIAAVILTSEGGFVKSECYTFETEQPAETEVAAE